jgi:hypothetical protein
MRLLKFILNSFLFLFLFIISLSCSNNKSDKQNLLFPVKAGNNWGYIDSTCSFNQSPVYQSAGEFFCNRSLVSKDGKISFVDLKGNVLMPFKFINATQFNEGKSMVLDEQNFISCIDTNMNVLFRLNDIDEAHLFSDGLAAVRKNGKYGFINENNKLVIDCEYDAVLDFTEGLCGVANLMGSEDSTFYEWFFIDKTGKKVIDMEFDEVHEFKTGLASVAKNEKYGWIDKNGKYVFGNDFDECKSFSEGFASFYKNYGWGLININGKIIMEPSFSSIGEMHEGMAMFALGPNSAGYIDTAGKIIMKPIFKSASSFKNGIAYIEKNNKISLIRKNGKLFCEDQFDSAPGFLGSDLGFIDFSLNTRVEVIIDTLLTDSTAIITKSKI